MKEYKVLYVAEVETPDNPVATYRKLYPKADGWYTLDSDGLEIKIEGLRIVDQYDTLLDQKPKLKFDAPFTITVEGDTLVVSLWGEDMDMFMHDNDAHLEPFTLLADFLAHLDDVAPHGIIIADLHTQNTDTKLDEGGLNEVSAEEIRAYLDSSEAGGFLFTALAETQVIRQYRTYMADCLLNNVSFVLPTAVSSENHSYVFRQGRGTYAMTVVRSELEQIFFNGSLWEGITTDVAGTWFVLQSDGTHWYVTQDSGLGATNEI